MDGGLQLVGGSFLIAGGFFVWVLRRVSRGLYDGCSIARLGCFGVTTLVAYLFIALGLGCLAVVAL